MQPPPGSATYAGWLEGLEIDIVAFRDSVSHLIYRVFR